jgi:hypothetical protein
LAIFELVQLSVQLGNVIFDLLWATETESYWVLPDCLFTSASIRDDLKHGAIVEVATDGEVVLAGAEIKWSIVSMATAPNVENRVMLG